MTMAGSPGDCDLAASYSYSTGTWGDLLTNYNGTSITYDTIGNPTNWRNATSLTWSGRKLTRQDISSTSSVTYGYNADGIRVSKSYNSSSERLSRSHQYILDGTNVIYEKQQTVAQFGGETNELYYHYDESGVAGFELNGTVYYYLKNIQGDVINILNSSGQVVVTYTYDAWGKVLSVTGSLASTVGQINPFRYRGYYYDTETGFYYLQTRYYDPEVGRFLNADGIIGANGDIQGYNLFAYCSNRPTIAADHSGEFIGLIIFGVAVVCTVVVVVDVASSYPNRKSNKEHNVEQAKKLPSGFIENQDTLNNYKIGWGTMDKNGCGCVAVYNAMILLGDTPSLPDVIEYYDRFYRNILFAFLGTSPFSIKSYFQDKGYDVITGHLDKIDETAKKHRASIILYIHSSGMHYVAFSYDEKIQKFVFHNPEIECDSIDEFLGDNTVFQVWYIK